ncbi:SIS domain-containing protein [Caldilinea sp.]|jgi:hypothetical protein|uniref:SIS domain-containing protein n=1 Tax=Caldilinea sp. TaxID=2293560 RepID=UPI002627E361|nr:SIS domain-containing protein [uncultured Caldilinea sp.]
MSELDNLELYAFSRLYDRAGDPTHPARGLKAAQEWLARQPNRFSSAAPRFHLPYDVRPLANAVAHLCAPGAEPAATVGDGVDALDLRGLLHFDEHPAYTFTFLWALARAALGQASAPPALDLAWLQSLTPTTPFAANPAKQLAQRCYARVPLLWAEESWQSEIAHDWRLRILRYAESAAIVADFSEMQHGWSMARFPNFWINALCVVKIGAIASDNEAQANMLQSILQKRRFNAIQVDAPGGDPVTRAVHLLYFGEWAALYLAALYGVEPEARVPLQLLGLIDGRTS